MSPGVKEMIGEFQTLIALVDIFCTDENYFGCVVLNLL
jgi:hypothetical protein